MGQVLFSLNPLHTKCHLGRPRKNRIKSQFQDKRTIYCLWCHMSGHNVHCCNFLMEHITKLGAMLVKHKQESYNWKGSIGPKIEEKMTHNIVKGEVYPITPFMNGIFGVCIRRAFLNVDIMNQTCTCRVWQMLGILCEHATTIILSIGQNVVDFLKYWYKFPMQELIYSGSFSSIKIHDMPSVDDDGLV